jgi:hypothetical protein
MSSERLVLFIDESILAGQTQRREPSTYAAHMRQCAAWEKAGATVIHRKGAAEDDSYSKQTPALDCLALLLTCNTCFFRQL